MKRLLQLLAKVSGLAMVIFLMGAGDVTVYQGVVRSIKGDSVTVLQKNGGTIQCKVAATTPIFISGKRLPVNRIMLNSHVQIDVDRQNVCLQVVVEEAPK